MKISNVTGLLIAIVVSAAMASCARGAALPAVLAAPSASTPIDASKASPRGLLADPFAPPGAAERIVYADGLVSDPLPNPPAGVITAVTAIQSALSDRISSELRPGEPTATLRSVTVGPVGESGTTASPAWILTWRGSKPDIHGPVGLSTALRQKLENSECIFVVVVDAESGAVTDTRQFCRQP